MAAGHTYYCGGLKTVRGAPVISIAARNRDLAAIEPSMLMSREAGERSRSLVNLYSIGPHRTYRNAMAHHNPHL